MLFYVDEHGNTLERRIDVSSGHEDFDAAAMRVAEVFRFRSAYSVFSPRAAWTRYPITFQLEQCSAYFYHQYCTP